MTIKETRQELYNDLLALGYAPKQANRLLDIADKYASDKAYKI